MMDRCGTLSTGPRWREDDVIFYVGPTSIGFYDTLVREESFLPVAETTVLRLTA